MGALGSSNGHDTATDVTGVRRRVLTRHRGSARAGRQGRLDRRAEPVVPRLAPAASQLPRARLARVVPADPAGLRARAGVRKARRAHRFGHEPHHRAGQGRRQGRDRHLGGRDVYGSQDGRAPRPPGDDPRPDLVARRRQVRPRRRRQRPRRRRAAPLRRHQLAHGRHRFGADLCDLRRDPGVARRLLRRLGRLGDHAFLRPRLGVPRDPALDRARLGSRHQRLPPLRHQPRGRQSLDPDARHLVRAHPVHRPAAPRSDSVAAREGVRGGGDRTGLLELSRDVLGDPPEHRLVDTRLLRADHREQHPAGGRAVVPRSGHPGPEPVVGQADRGRADPHHDRALADDRSRASPSS